MKQKRILVPTGGPEDWRRLLAKPDLHWRDGFSAKCASDRWEEANALPPEIARQFQDCGYENAELLMAVPEFKTELPGGGAASQSDIFAIVRTERGVFATAIEAKVSEPFGETIGEWLRDASPGKIIRLKGLCELLGLTFPPGEDLRYQLFHRCGAALIEAERFGFAGAAMIVHSFSTGGKWLEDYSAFRKALGITADDRSPAVRTAKQSRPLLLGWAQG